MTGRVPTMKELAELDRAAPGLSGTADDHLYPSSGGCPHRGWTVQGPCTVERQFAAAGASASSRSGTPPGLIGHAVAAPGDTPRNCLPEKCARHSG